MKDVFICRSCGLVSTLRREFMPSTELTSEIGVTDTNLADCLYAKVWAKEFCKLNTASDEGTMLGWFANAIMAGYAYAKRETVKE